MRLVLLALLALPGFAQRDLWSKPYPAHTIAGNLHFVGTADLACFLISTPQGHILINTGLTDSVPMIRDSISKLGFKIEDVRILLTMQAHHDHTAGLAEIQRLSKAKMFATQADAPILEDGGVSDPAFGGKQNFDPIKVDRKLKHGDLIKLGGVTLRTELMAGHTPGSVGYSMNIGGQNVLIANMGSVVMPLINPKYPTIVEDYKRTFAMQKKLRPDIWLAGHGSQYGMAAKHAKGSFVDRQGYRDAVDNYEKLFLERLAKERP